MAFKAIFSLFLLLVISGKLVQSDITFNFDNQCSFTVWLAASPSIGDGDPERGPGTLEIFSMPDTWTGSIWARKKCSFNPSMTNFSCETGDCGSGTIDCQSPPPTPPVTLLNFGINQNVVSYEVSLNHGFNVPVRIQPVGGSLVGGGSGPCPVVDCIKDLKDVCDAQLAAGNINGSYVGCNSPCDALKDPKYCCTGSFSGPACQPNEFSTIFKQELNQIDNVPKFNKLPTKAAAQAKRSSSSSSSPASPSAPGFLSQVSYDRDEASSATLTSFNGENDGRKKLHDSVDCSKSWDERPGSVLHFHEFPSVEVESDALNKVSDPCSGRVFHRKVVEQKSDKKKLQIRGSNGVCLAPGNVVWAKTACQEWWPAEVRAWVDAARDISLLEDCFEERSCNPKEHFQDALKQAIVQRKEHLKSCRLLPGSPDFSNHSDQQDEKSGKRTSSTSSKPGSNLVKQGGIKKERKPPIHLDDTAFPLKSAEGARRLKIMRYLGLKPPRGSPF
ncbi:Thaumatin [Corchorus olitorius]|uniref:Thaumatin n=1 Tax=Corchorus olitorius TaxID=93759 RepID=A0A1R3HU90_9ROSI|nr:Thaumatin [Corchorus olitorius]